MSSRKQRRDLGMKVERLAANGFTSRIMGLSSWGSK